MHEHELHVSQALSGAKLHAIIALCKLLDALVVDPIKHHAEIRRIAGTLLRAKADDVEPGFGCPVPPRNAPPKSPHTDPQYSPTASLPLAALGKGEGRGEGSIPSSSSNPPQPDTPPRDDRSATRAPSASDGPSQTHSHHRHCRGRVLAIPTAITRRLARGPAGLHDPPLLELAAVCYALIRVPRSTLLARIHPCGTSRFPPIKLCVCCS
jgi:hypothetical protein